jgi:methylmalonyl-CoA/ethylmalonyl-CoA epimerase
MGIAAPSSHDRFAGSATTSFATRQVFSASCSIDQALLWFQRYFPTYPRNPKQISEQARGGFLWQDFFLGGVVFEFIEELPERRDFIARFLERHGEGLHHIAFEVDRLDPIVAALKSAGVRIVDEYNLADGTRTAFISPRLAFGALVQLWQPIHYDKPTQPPLDNRGARFDHLAIAVRDLGAALAFFHENFGGEVVQEPVRSETQGNFLLAHIQVGGLVLESLQSSGEGKDDDFVAHYIAKHGEGMHHFTINVAEFEALLVKLNRDGVRVVGKETNYRGGRQFFISPRSAFGTLIQVWGAS